MFGAYANTDCTVDSEYGDYETCNDEGFLIAGSVFAGVFGTASLVFFVTGGVVASTNSGRMRRLSAVRTTTDQPTAPTALRTPRLEFVGAAPLLDVEREPRGLALAWRF